MVSMFSATYPHENGVVLVAQPQWVSNRLLMLPEVLRDRGFRTVGVVANSVLGRESNFPQGFERYRELWMEDSATGSRTNAEHASDVALEELARLAATGASFFLWIHYIDPHRPYEPPPGYAEPFLVDEFSATPRVPVDRTRGRIFPSIPTPDDAEEDLARYVANYDGEIRYTDDEIGRLLRGLDEHALGDSTLVVFTSDHGESLGEHGYYFYHGHLPYEPEVRVPLVFAWPEGRYAGQRITTPVELRGLGPTLLEALGIPGEQIFFEAPSFLPAIRSRDAGRLPPVVFSEAGAYPSRVQRGYTLSIREGPLRLVLLRSEWAREVHGGREVELYDLDRDPREQHDLAPAQPARTRALRRELGKWFAATASRSNAAKKQRQPVYREQTKKALRELGYLE
jgi:arylsulfatase A-like enzyme